MRQRSFAWEVVAGVLGCGSERLAGSRRARREGATGAAAPSAGPISTAGVDPDPIVEIYLFGDRRSYLRHALELFGDEPETPYGHFSAEHQALIMNIATGGGTWSTRSSTR